MENEVAQPDAGAPGEPEPVPAAGGCVSCGAAMEPDQDWCLACGTAAPGRVDDRPGMRTVARVAALTLVLLVTAVGASYAALTHGSDTTLIATAPPVVPAPAPAPTVPATTPAAPATTTATTKATPPPVVPDDTPTVTPEDTFTQDTPAPEPEPTSVPEPTPTPRVTPNPTPAKPKTTTVKATKIGLEKNAIALYDPYTRALSATDPLAVTDSDPTTVWTVVTAPSTDGMKVGLVIDMGTVRKASSIRFQTPTPGFSVEIYGAPGPTTTTGPQYPQKVPDKGWKHLRNAADLGSVNGNAVIRLGINGKGVSTYRYLLVWLAHQPPVAAGTRDVAASTDTTPTPTTTETVPPTTPPAPPTETTPVVPTTPPTTPIPPDAPTVSISELSVFG